LLHCYERIIEFCSLSQVFGCHFIIPSKHRHRGMPRDSHYHMIVNTSFSGVCHKGMSEVVEAEILNACLFTCGDKGSAS